MYEDIQELVDDLESRISRARHDSRTGLTIRTFLLGLWGGTGISFTSVWIMTDPSWAVSMLGAVSLTVGIATLLFVLIDRKERRRLRREASASKRQLQHIRSGGTVTVTVNHMDGSKTSYALKAKPPSKDHTKE